MLRTPILVFALLVPFVAGLFAVPPPEVCCTAPAADAPSEACCCTAGASARPHAVKSVEDAQPQGATRCPVGDTPTCRCTPSANVLYAIHRQVDLTPGVSSRALVVPPMRISDRTDEPMPPPPKPL